MWAVKLWNWFSLVMPSISRPSSVTRDLGKRLMPLPSKRTVAPAGGGASSVGEER